MMLSTRSLLLGLALVLLALAILAPVADAACPHNCSNHGRCSHNACTCDAGYAGTDCSIRILPVQSGVKISDSLNTFSWKYYSIDVPYGSTSLNVTIHQTNNWGDVDAYVSRGTLPTFASYLAKDDSVNKLFTVSINPAPPGTYFIGTYAYFHVEYELEATIISDCALDCGENGGCVNNQCQCHQYWTGETCDKYDQPLSSGATVFNSVADHEWKYYHIDVATLQVLDVLVEQTGTDTPTTCDVDVYIRKNDYPSMFEFDLANATVNPITEIVARNPGAGTYYIGVYGYHGCGYSITATVSAQVGCASECSRHGMCSGNVCVCTPGVYSGELCEEKLAPILLDTPEAGYVGGSEWNYYRLQQTTTNNILISVAQDLATSDCDLFVKRDSKPTNFNYDYSNLSFDQFFNVTIVDPSSATWYIGVYGWSDCGYTLTASIPTECGCAPAGHGRCAPNSAQCVCEFGWGGVGCDQQETLLQSGEVYQDSVHLNQWTYYRFASNSSAILVSMKELNTVGRLWLFASLNGFPSLDAYEVSDIGTKSDFHEVHFTFESQAQHVCYIGVYGSPFAPTDTEMSYKITAWAPPI